MRSVFFKKVSNLIWRKEMNKNKMPEKKLNFLSGTIKQIRKKNYSWTLNFGVEPLFFMSFFLFTPVLAFLVFLRVSVFFDKETINSLLRMIVNNEKNLTLRTHSVKVFLVLSLLVSLNSAQAMSDNSENIIIAIGEHKEIPLPSLERFTLSNTDCLTHKFIEKTKTMLIKGSKLGYPELVVWNKGKNNNKKIFRIYILTKQKQLKSSISFKQLRPQA